jgi:hypothetical protein
LNLGIIGANLLTAPGMGFTMRENLYLVVPVLSLSLSSAVVVEPAIDLLAMKMSCLVSFSQMKQSLQ